MGELITGNSLQITSTGTGTAPYEITNIGTPLPISLPGAATVNLPYVPQTYGKNAVLGKEVNLKFDVSLYGNVEQFDDSKSKCRARIFYRGLNRNRTYISEDFANKLIASLPYAPVKGIFNQDDVDFEDHGEKNSDGRIYGIVMAEPNFAWEDHMDDDGIIRTYACADVLLYTSLYQEAKLIPGSSQSMEINPYTYKGEWRIWEADGLPYFHFTDGSLFGLQALGTAVEPCFEGAAFYSLAKDVQELISYIKNIDSNNNKKEEDKHMEKELLFRLSDNDKARKIASALNPNFNEEGGWKFEYFLMDVYADYAVAASVEEEKYVRAYYTVNADESVTVGEKVEVEITDVTKDEMLALEALKAINNNLAEVKDTYEANVKAVEDLTAEKEQINSQLAEATKSVEEKATEIETLNNSLEEIKKELEEVKAEKVSLETLNSDLNKEKEELAQFKTNIETEQKKAVLEKYSEYINPEKYAALESEVANYSVEDFEKEVCTAAVKNTPTIFSKQEQSQNLIYTGNVDEAAKGESQLEAFIDKHLGGNK